MNVEEYLYIYLTSDNGIFKGTVTKQVVIINAVTPLGYSILEASKKPTFW